MRIDNPEAARTWAADWIASASPERARWQIAYALEGLHTVRSIVDGNPTRYSEDEREDVRGAIVALVAAYTRLGG